MDTEDQKTLEMIMNITADFQDVLEQRLGSQFVTGEGISEEARSSKIATGVAASTGVIQKLICLAIIQRLGQIPKDDDAERRVKEMVNDLTSMLQNRMANIVEEAMGEIAMAFMDTDENTTMQ